MQNMQLGMEMQQRRYAVQMHAIVHATQHHTTQVSRADRAAAEEGNHHAAGGEHADAAGALIKNDNNKDNDNTDHKPYPE